jgi:hypothetical protein
MLRGPGRRHGRRRRSPPAWHLWLLIFVSLVLGVIGQLLLTP